MHIPNPSCWKAKSVELWRTYHKRSKASNCIVQKVCVTLLALHIATSPKMTQYGRMNRAYLAEKKS